MKANQKARFSIFNFLDAGKISLPENLDRKLIYLDRKLIYLDYDEIISRIPQVKQALRSIKARKREEKKLVNYNTFACVMISKNTRRHDKSTEHIVQIKKQRSDCIQRGFDIVEKWKNEERNPEDN